MPHKKVICDDCLGEMVWYPHDDKTDLYRCPDCNLYKKILKEGISTTKKSEMQVTKMKDEFLEDLSFMLKEYANGRDDEMTVGARELKAETIRILNENGWYGSRVKDGTNI